MKIRWIQGIGLEIEEWGESGSKCRKIIKGVAIIYFPKIFQSFRFYYIAAPTLSFLITKVISLKNWRKWRKKISSQIITLVISAVLILICCHWILLVTLFNWTSYRTLLLLECRFLLWIRKTVEDWNCKILEELVSERVRNHVGVEYAIT